jgi:hypothetical protein
MSFYQTNQVEKSWRKKLNLNCYLFSKRKRVSFESSHGFDAYDAKCGERVCYFSIICMDSRCNCTGGVFSWNPIQKLLWMMNEATSTNDSSIRASYLYRNIGLFQSEIIIARLPCTHNSSRWSKYLQEWLIYDIQTGIFIAENYAPPIIYVSFTGCIEFHTERDCFLSLSLILIRPFVFREHNLFR